MEVYLSIKKRRFNIKKKIITHRSITKPNELVNKSSGVELDLHGMIVDDAILGVDKFLNEKFRSGHYRVWIIHGKGTGILRQEVRCYLSKHPLVMSHRSADPQHGGEGATQVELRET